MREDWVEHIVQAKEDLRNGARAGTQADVRLARGDEELEFKPGRASADRLLPTCVIRP